MRGASRLAAAVGLPPLVIGLTVVAFGTSSPELTVSVLSALEGQAGAGIADVMLFITVPATVLILMVAVVRQTRRKP